MILLHRLLQVSGFLLERLMVRRAARHAATRVAEEMLRSSIVNRRRRSRASARRQTRARRHDWEIASGHARTADLLARRRNRTYTPSTEASGTDR